MPVNQITPEQIAGHVEQLQRLGDTLEAAGSADWLPVARAAALLEALRFGAVEIAFDAPPLWVGIDLVQTSPPCATFGGPRHA